MNMRDDLENLPNGDEIFDVDAYLGRKSNDTQPSDYSADDVEYDGDSSYQCELTQADLDNISMIESRDTVNSDLFVVDIDAETDASGLYSLFTEGALSGEKTGKDTGIYAYKPVVEEPVKEKPAARTFFSYEDILNDPIIEATSDIVYGEIDDSSTTESIIAPGFSSGTEPAFMECMLAQYDPLGGPQTQVVRTFRGYLEVLRPMGILRANNCFEPDVGKVYVPEFYIDKYKLRNGDEIACVYTEQCGKFVLQSLLTINGVTYSNWDPERAWFDEISCEPKPISVKGSDTNKCIAIIRKLQLCRGDNVFVHFRDYARELKWTQEFIKLASELFDRVVVINPKVINDFELVNADNVVNFSAEVSDPTHNQIMACVMGANYVKRLVEMGKSVAVFVDHLHYLSSLDSGFNGENPVTKTVFSCIKANRKGGSIMFAMFPFSNVQKTYNFFNSFETVSLMVDKGEADLFSSKRL